MEARIRCQEPLIDLYNVGSNLTHSVKTDPQGPLNCTIVSETAKNWIASKQPLWLSFQPTPANKSLNEPIVIIAKSRYGNTAEEISRNMREMNRDPDE